MKIKYLLFIFLTGLVISGFAQNHTYFVAGTGIDSNKGTIESPFKTIQYAAKIMLPGDTCQIREGLYRERVIPGLSGIAGKPIVFMAYGCEKVTVSGATILTNPWTVYKGSIYKTYMPWTMGLGRNQLFVDGRIEVEARHPNVRTSGAMAMPPVSVPLSPLWPHAFGNFEVKKGSDIITSPTDLNQDQKDYWKGALYLGFHGWSWCMQTAVVTGSSKGQITYGNRTKMWWFPDDADMGASSYKGDTIQNGYLTNHLHALDMAGEWHWQNDTLYLWPSNNQDPTQSIVEAKKRQLAFDLRDRNFIELKNISVFSSSVNMYNANNCTLDGCRLSYVSHFQQWVSGREGMIDGGNPSVTSALFRGEVGVIVGGNDNTIKNSIIEYSSGAGLYLNGNNTTVTNCIIHDCGYTSTYLGCIYMFNDLLDPHKVTGGHSITHCDLYNAGRAIISVFGSLPQTSFDAMEISNNRIHDGSILSNDGGLFNSWCVDLGTVEKKTQIQKNLIWDQWSEFLGGLVYADNNSYKMEAHNNVIWYSNTNQYGLKDRLFWMFNAPIDCTYKTNTQKNNYAKGVQGLLNSDYPGGYFETGTSFNLNSTNCELATSAKVIQMKANKFSVFPNPASQKAMISYHLQERNDILISVYDSLGKEVWRSSKRKQEIGEHQLSLNVKNFNNGVYFIQMRIDKQQLSEKLIVNN